MESQGKGQWKVKEEAVEGQGRGSGRSGTITALDSDSLLAVLVEDEPLSRRLVDHREEQGRHRPAHLLGRKPQRILDLLDFTQPHLHSEGDRITRIVAANTHPVGRAAPAAVSIAAARCLL